MYVLLCYNMFCYETSSHSLLTSCIGKFLLNLLCTHTDVRKFIGSFFGILRHIIFAILYLCMINVRKLAGIPIFSSPNINAQLIIYVETKETKKGTGENHRSLQHFISANGRLTCFEMCNPFCAESQHIGHVSYIIIAT